MSSITLVTGYFDLIKRGSKFRRTGAQYLELAKYIIILDIPIIVFCEPEYIHIIEEIKDPKGKVTIVPITLEEMDYYQHLDTIKANFKKRTIYLGLSDEAIHEWMNRSGPLYTVAIWSKFNLLRKAIKLNPYGTEIFAWIDFGIFHHHFDHPNLRYQIINIRNGILSLPSDRITVNVIYQDKDHGLIYNSHRAINGAFVSGERLDMLWLCDIFDKVARQTLKDGHAPFEEDLLFQIVFQNRDRFRYIYSTYSSLCNNMIGYVYRIDWVVYNILKPCEYDANWSLALTICDDLYPYITNITRSVISVYLRIYIQALRWIGNRLERLSEAIRDLTIVEGFNISYEINLNDSIILLTSLNYDNLNNFKFFAGLPYPMIVFGYRGLDFFTGKMRGFSHTYIYEEKSDFRDAIRSANIQNGTVVWIDPSIGKICKGTSISLSRAIEKMTDGYIHIHNEDTTLLAGQAKDLLWLIEQDIPTMIRNYPEKFVQSYGTKSACIQNCITPRTDFDTILDQLESSGSDPRLISYLWSGRVFMTNFQYIRFLLLVPNRTEEMNESLRILQSFDRVERLKIFPMNSSRPLIPGSICKLKR